jgi:NADH:ubiquinone oxidoreductase subunit 4 (subunit M)
MLIIILMSPLLGIYFLTIIPLNKKILQRNIAVTFSFISFLFSINFWLFFPEGGMISFEFILNQFILSQFIGLLYIELKIKLIVTPFTIVLIVLVTYLIFSCIFFISYEIKVNLSEVLVMFLCLNFLIVCIVSFTSYSLCYFIIYI